MKPFLVLSFIFFSLLAKAQNITTVLQNGNISITQDTMIKVLMDYTQFNSTNKLNKEGYRIQLTSSSVRKSVLELKVQFSILFPNTKAYIEYQNPSFKLRVGDFETRISANAFQQEIVQKFPNAFIVRDFINLEE